MIREPIWKAVWKVNRIIPVSLVGLLVFNLIFTFYLTSYLEEKAAIVKSEVIRLQADERQALRGRGNSESPVIIYTRGIADLQKFRQTIPDKAKLSSLVDELFSLADRAGLSLDSVNYNSEKEPEQQLLNYKIDYKVTGTYKQIKKMIHLIEQSDRIIFIDKMSLGSVSSDKSVSLSLTLTTFFTMGQA
jgi:Tfp pilus assembly protein PilO